MFKSSIYASFLALSLVACGGGGGGGSSTPPSSPSGGGTVAPPAVQRPNVLFINDVGNRVIAGFDSLTIAPGTTFSSANLIGNKLGGDVQIDRARDLMYTAEGQTISIFGKARTLTGTVTPARTVKPAMPDTDWYAGHIVLDAANDRLYVGYGRGAVQPGRIAVFDQASTLSGQAKPSYFLDGMINGFRFDIDTKRALLYTVFDTDADDSVLVYSNVDKPSPAAQVPRRIDFFDRKFRLAVDAERDVLYVVVEGRGIKLIRNASKGSSGLASSFIFLADLNAESMLAVDPANDRLYAALGSTIYLLNEASTMGSGVPQRIVPVNLGGNAIITGFAF